MLLSHICKIACLLVSPLALTLVGGTQARDQYPILDQGCRQGKSEISELHLPTVADSHGWRRWKRHPTPRQQKAIQFCFRE